MRAKTLDTKIITYVFSVIKNYCRIVRWKIFSFHMSRSEPVIQVQFQMMIMMMALPTQQCVHCCFQHARCKELFEAHTRTYIYSDRQTQVVDIIIEVCRNFTETPNTKKQIINKNLYNAAIEFQWKWLILVSTRRRWFMCIKHNLWESK